jgi:hypothetical protein
MSSIVECQLAYQLFGLIFMADRVATSVCISFAVMPSGLEVGFALSAIVD